MPQPLVAITMGDPAGIGPETVAAAWPAALDAAGCRAFVVGHPEVLRRAARLVRSPARVVEISAAEEASSSPDHIPCLATGPADAADIPPAQIDARGGRAAYEAVARAAAMALQKDIDAMVTGPLNKAALWAAGHRYPGHTELLAELCGAKDVAMMLYLGPSEGARGRGGLGVAHVTLHMALRDVFAALSPEAILVKARLADGIMRAFLSDVAEAGGPRIGVCALNPHAGEEGLFGDEERRIIAPAVERGRREGLRLEGPLPADTLLVRAAAGDFDAVVAMYHDQGHIALKLLGMHRAVNITLGLPIVRTSVAHGTAFDRAWQGVAETSGMVEAVRVASHLARRKTG
jgi:4-hydroxythreonine-4-phosphate dehydrogenase